MSNNLGLRLFVDMDGTLARFHDQVNYLERMFEKDFFRNLEPFENMVEGVRQFILNNPDVEVFILSARVNGEPPYCEEEKNAWVDKYLPEIDQEHRIYTEMGKSKADYIPGGISYKDYLLDDYNKGLNLWLYDGGSAIKCHNNINQRGLGAYGGSAGMLWTGKMVHTEDRPEMIAAEIAHNMGLGYILDLNKVAPAVDFNHANAIFKEYKNNLNAVRFLEGKSEFEEIQMWDMDKHKISIPRFQADAIANNYYGCEHVYNLLDGAKAQYPPDVANVFVKALEESQNAIVGYIEYLGSTGIVGERVPFYSLEEMKKEIQDCRDCGRPIAEKWFVDPMELVTLHTHPDKNTPESFVLSSKNLCKAAELCDLEFPSLDDFLFEYTWDDSKLIWDRYGQYVDKLAEIMDGFAPRREVENRFFEMMREPEATPVSAALDLASNIEEWARWDNADAFHAGVAEKAEAFKECLKGGPAPVPVPAKSALDNIISGAKKQQEKQTKTPGASSPER